MDAQSLQMEGFEVSAAVAVTMSTAHGRMHEDAAVPDEQVLVEQAREYPSAFVSLYELHYDAIARHLYRRTGRREATEDLISDTFLLALRHLSRYKDRGMSFRSWLYRIATNEANNWSRRQKRNHRIIEDVSEIVDERSEGDRDTLELDRARRVMRRLAPRFQAVLALYHLEGMSVAEVATVLDCRRGTVKSRLARGRKALRVELEKEVRNAQQSRRH